MPSKNIEELWGDVRVWLTDATKTALKEAEDLTRHGRLKMDLMRTSRELEKKMADLGAKVYARLSRNPDVPVVADEELKVLMWEISRLESQLAESQQEYEEEKKRN
jgi:predicted RNase H-like nuclease (RuvC/YqgF family)